MQLRSTYIWAALNPGLVTFLANLQQSIAWREISRVLMSDRTGSCGTKKWHKVLEQGRTPGPFAFQCHLQDVSSQANVPPSAPCKLRSPRSEGRI